MQEEKVRGKPARHRPANPHHAPRGVRRSHIKMYSALEKPYVGLSDGRIYDPRSGYALDWWGTGAPEFHEEADGTWALVFADAAAVCTPEGISVVTAPEHGQLRVQVPPPDLSPAVEPDPWIRNKPPYIKSRSRRLRRERLQGRRPVREGCPLLRSQRTDPQEWPPPKPREIASWQRR